jgi:uncharacterized HAD superfamily protein
MSPRRIYVDLDDVLAETGKTFLEVLERDFGKRMEFEQIHDYDLGRSLGLDRQQLAEFMQAVHRPEVLAAIPPLAGAIEAVSDWMVRGYQVEVVTGRPRQTEEVSRAWLEGVDLGSHELTFVDKYAWEEDLFRSTTGVPLGALADQDYCLAVEDSAEVARRLADLLDAPIVLLDRPWNRNGPEPSQAGADRIVRCHDWNEIRSRFFAP